MLRRPARTGDLSPALPIGGVEGVHQSDEADRVYFYTPIINRDGQRSIC